MPKSSLTREEVALTALGAQLANTTVTQECLNAGLTPEQCIAEIVRLSFIAADEFVKRAGEPA